MNEKILLIEDDSTMLKLLQTFLQFEGFQALLLPGKENSLEQTMDLIRNEMPAVILLDVYMHQFNGFELLHAIREDEQAKNIGVVITSGADFRKKCIEEGADRFLLKPYMPEELIQSIHNVIANKANPDRE